MGLIVLALVFMSQIALGQEHAPPTNAACEIIENVAMTWPFFGKLFGVLTAAALFLRPFSNLILKGALVLTAMPTPAAQAAGKIVWIVGTIASLPAAGTPAVMQQVYAGSVEAPVKMPKKKAAP